jgi:hypothetical protein
LSFIRITGADTLAEFSDVLSSLSTMFVIRFHGKCTSNPPVCSAIHRHDQSSYINTLQFLRGLCLP